MSPQVNVTHANGDTDSVPATVGYQYRRELGNMWRLTIDLERSDAQSLNLDPKGDEVELSGVTTGRLVDVDSGGAFWTLKVYSFEWDGQTVSPTDGGVRIQGTDKSLIDARINEVSSWSIGNTNALTGTLTYVQNHAFPHETIRRIERNAPGEVEFDGQTVNYVQERGTDKSGSVVLTPDNQNVTGEITVEDKGRTMDATHVRLIGAHEGEAQLTTNLVPDGDNTNYGFDNKVTYTTSRWSSSDDTDWDVRKNKDLMSQDAIDEAAQALADELVDPYYEVKATVENEDLVLGDYVQVKKPDAGIDRKMRIHRITTTTDTGEESTAATVDKLLLSTRNIAREDPQKELADIQRYNKAFQGSAMWGTVAGGVQAVDSGLNYTLSFFYPDVDYEHFVELQVKSIPYRVFHSGGAASSSSVISSASGVIQSELNQGNGLTSEIILTDDDSHTLTFKTKDPSNYFTAKLDVFTDWATDVGGGTIDYDLHFFHAGGVDHENNNRRSYIYGDFYQQTTHTFSISDNTDFDVTWTNRDGETHNLDTGTDVDLNYYGDHTHDVDPADHTHPVDPGVTEFPNETASGVDVIVNGNTEATDINSGTFEQTVDISNALTTGSWNTVEVTSDSLGVMLCTLAADVYRQVGAT